MENGFCAFQFFLMFIEQFFAEDLFFDFFFFFYFAIIHVVSC